MGKKYKNQYLKKPYKTNCVMISVMKILMFFIFTVAYYPPLAGRPSAAGAGPPGGPGGQQVVTSGVPAAGTQNVPLMPIGGPPAGSVVPGMAPGGSDVTGGPQQQGSVSSHPGVNQGGNKPKRKHAIDIVDPKTLKVVDVASDSKGSGTPPHSGESSARETPQPVSRKFYFLRTLLEAILEMLYLFLFLLSISTPLETYLQSVQRSSM